MPRFYRKWRFLRFWVLWILLCSMPGIWFWVAVGLLMAFNLLRAWQIIRGLRGRTGSHVVDVDDDLPLKGWKVAQVTTARDKPFRPLVSTTRYGRDCRAECPTGIPGIPHEDHHYCGFYAFMKKRRLLAAELSIPGAAVLEVELSGTVLEGSRGILRGGYQRVLQVGLPAFCVTCETPIPRPTAGFVLRDGHYESSCEKCAHGKELSSLQDLQELTGTEVRLSDGLIATVSRLFWAPFQQRRPVVSLKKG